MATIKTAISLEPSLLEQVDALSKKLQISRSRLFVLAMTEFIQHYQNKKLLEDINAAYGDTDKGEQKVLKYMRKRQQERVKDQW